MEKLIIDIVEEFTNAPGGRLKSQGKHSGEEFREELLKPNYLEAQKSQKKLCIILDGGFGYATSFLEEAFGGLARELRDPGLLNIEIVSEEEPALVEKINNFMKSALNR